MSNCNTIVVFPVSPSACLSACLPVCLSVSLSVCLYAISHDLSVTFLHKITRSLSVVVVLSNKPSRDKYQFNDGGATEQDTCNNMAAN